MKQRIYFDNAATTPVDVKVIEAMEPYSRVSFGNASSLHSYGTEASDILHDCRSKIAGFIGAKTNEIIFTSGGTESNNLALKGIAFSHRKKGNHIIVSAIEHDCILNTARWLETQGFEITYLPVNEHGMVQPDILQKSLKNSTILVSVMHANNEIGTIQPISAIGNICRQRNILFHSDACQSFGKTDLNVEKIPVDLLTINSHKIHGPKGVGALYIRQGTEITPLLHGGGQESGLRSSTENIQGIAGFIRAAELCFINQQKDITYIKDLRDYIAGTLISKYDFAYLNGHPVERLPNIINIAFHGLEGETMRLLLLLDEAGIAVSAGSACSSNNSGSSASHVLQAIGRDPFQARGSVRISLSRLNTKEEADRFFEVLDVVLKQLNPIFS